VDEQTRLDQGFDDVLQSVEDALGAVFQPRGQIVALASNLLERSIIAGPFMVNLYGESRAPGREEAGEDDGGDTRQR
jgi:hypothetical protein